jgi:hypothetical protein
MRASVGDDGYHSFRLQPHLSVAEAKHPQPSRLQVRRSLDVTLHSLSRQVLAAIKLDHQPRIHAVEIKHVGAERMLAPKFGAIQPSISQKAPHDLLGVGPVPPEGAGAKNFAAVRRTRLVHSGNLPALTLALSPRRGIFTPHFCDSLTNANRSRQGP